MSAVSSTITHGITLSASGTYKYPLTITATGYIDNTGTGTGIYGPSTQLGYVGNFGAVAGGTAGAGVVIEGVGYVLNRGRITGGAGAANSSALGAGGAGLVLAAGGKVFNYGTLAGGSGGAGGASSATGGQGGFGLSVTGTGTVAINNSIMLTGGAGGAGQNAATAPGRGGKGGGGVSVAGPALFLNTGTVAGGAGGGGGYASAGGSTGGGGGDGGTGVTLSQAVLFINGSANGSSGLIAGGAGGAGGPSSGTGGAGGAGGAGIVLSGTGTFTNQTSVQGGAGGVGASSPLSGQGGTGGAGIIMAAAGTISNTGGLIRGGSGGASGSSAPAGAGGVGVAMVAGGSLSNTGTIFGGDGGLDGAQPGASGNGVVLVAGGVVVNGGPSALGALIGGRNGVVANGVAAATVINYGVIESTGGDAGTGVQFTAPGSVLIVEGGSSVVGTVSGGGGTLKLGGSVGPGTLSGLGSHYVGFSQISVLSGAAWSFDGSNTLAGGTTLTDAGSLTLADASILSAGDSLIVTANATLDGTGLLAIGAGGRVDLRSSATATGTIAFGVAGGTLEIDGPTMPSVTVGGFAPGDTIDLTGIAFTASEKIVYDGQHLEVTDSGGNPLATLNAPNLSIPSGYRLALAADNRPTPGAEIIFRTSIGTITNTIAHGITLSTAGAYISPLTVTAAGYIDNTGSGAAITGPKYAQNTPAWTVSNYGRVIGGGAGAGILFASTGTISNDGRITGGDGIANSATASTGGTGVSLMAGGTVINFAAMTITGGAGGAGGSNSPAGGQGGAGLVGAGAVSLTNEGLVTGGAGGVGVNPASATSTPPSAGGTGGIGVSLAAGIFVNVGTVTGGAGGAPGIYPGNTLSVFGGNGGAGGTGIYLSGPVDFFSGSYSGSNGLVEGGAGHAGVTAVYGGYGGAGGAGMIVAGSADLTNDETIRGGDGGNGGTVAFGSPGGTGGAGIVMKAGGTLDNAGRIQGGAGGDAVYLFSGQSNAAGGAGIVLSAGGTLNNIGTIGGGLGGDDPSGLTPGAAGNGVALTAGGIVVNGSAGESSAPLIIGGVGLVASGTGATVTNFGVISSLQFGSAGDVLILEGSGRFNASVEGGGGTLDLAGDNGAGLLGDIGSQYAGFSQINVLAGANWTLVNGSTLAAGSSLSVAGSFELADVSLIDNSAVTLSSTGTLTGIGAVTIGAAGTVDVQSGATPNVAFVFGTAGGTLEIDGSTPSRATVSNFAPGDKIDLTGIAFSATDSITFDGQFLNVSDGGGNILTKVNDPSLVIPIDNRLALIGDSLTPVAGTEIVFQRFGHTISSTITHGVTLSTAGTYISPLTVAAAGYVYNTGSGAAITAPNLGQNTPVWTVSNYGRVLGGMAGEGILFATTGTVFNDGKITGGAGIPDNNTVAGTGGTGVSLAAGGTVINFATMTIAGGTGGAGGSDNAHGGQGGAGLVGAAPVFLTNEGTLAGGAGGAGLSVSAYKAGAGAGGRGGFGVSLASATFVNVGIVTGGAGGAGGSNSHDGAAGGAGGAGIYLTGSVDFFNGSFQGTNGLVEGGAGNDGARGETDGNAGPGGDAGAGGAGMMIGGSADLTNDTTIQGGKGGSGAVFIGKGGAGGAAIVASAGGTLNNAGTLQGGAGGGAVSGPGGAGGSGIVLSAGGTLNNTGTIAGGSGGASQFAAAGMGGSGVVLTADGSIYNGTTLGSTALITGYGGVFDSGTVGSSTIVNLGTIRSLSPTVGAGIDLAASAVVTNQADGLIAGGLAGIAIADTTPILGVAIFNIGTISGQTGISIAAANLLPVVINNYGTIASTLGVSGTAIDLGTVSGQQILIGPVSSLVGVIADVQVGDKFLVPALAFDATGSATLGAGNVLQISEDGTSFTIDLDPQQNFAGETFALTAGSLGTVVTLQRQPEPSPVVLNDFGWNQGWGSPDNPRFTADIDGNGTTDYVGFGFNTTFISYGGTFSDGQGHTGPGFTAAVASVDDFGTEEGYSASVQRGAAMTGAGDGASIYGQGFLGVFWYAATGETPQTDVAGKTYDVLQYQSTPNLYGNFGSQEGWTPANGFQVVKASTADSFASILGFGNFGIVVGPQAFSPNATAADSFTITLAVGNNDGWNQQVDVRTFTDTNGNALDLNHDGITDFVGMGPQGLDYALGSETGGTYGLGALTTANIGVNGGGPDLGEAQGWNDATTLRNIVKDPQTGFDDILAFGAPGVFASMGQDPATHGGQAFGQLYLAMPDFGSDQGWSVRRRRASSAMSMATASPTSSASAPTRPSRRSARATLRATCISRSTRTR